MTYCAFVQCLGLENQDFVLENSFEKLYLNPDFYTRVSNTFFTTHHALDMAYLVSKWFDSEAKAGEERRPQVEL